MRDRFAWLEQVAGDRLAEYGETIARHAEAAYHVARELRSARAGELGRRAFQVFVSAATRARLRADPAAATELYSRAAQVGEAVGLPMTERVEAEAFSALTGYYVEGTSEAVERLDRVIDAARQVGPSEVLVRSSAKADLGICLVWLANNALQRRDFAAAERHVDEAGAEAEASGSKFQLWAVRRLASRVAIARGEHARAVRLANEAVELGHEVGAKRLIGLAYVRLGDALYEAGETAHARSILEQAQASIDQGRGGDAAGLALSGRGSRRPPAAPCPRPARATRPRPWRRASSWRRARAARRPARSRPRRRP